MIVTQVGMCLFLHPRTGHESRDGEQSYNSALSLTSALDVMGCQCQAPAALPPRKRPGTHCAGDWVGPRVRKSSPPAPIFDPRTVQPVASRYTESAVQAHLSRLQKRLKYLANYHVLLITCNGLWAGKYKNNRSKRVGRGVQDIFIVTQSPVFFCCFVTLHAPIRREIVWYYATGNIITLRWCIMSILRTEMTRLR